MAEKKQNGLLSKIKIPDGVTATINESLLTIKGQKGEVTRNFFSPLIKLNVKDNIIELSSKSQKRKFSKVFYTMMAHIENMICGVKDGFVYELKVCSGHFPMTLKKEKDEIIISNFLGEKIPRKSKILPGVEVEVKGDKITVKSPDLEKAGQTAVNIERATAIKKRDIRVFQDGCYITSKPGRK